MGNEVLRSYTLYIDDYEEGRTQRRVRDELRVHGVDREYTLRQEGYSRNEILQVTLKMDRIRIRRRNNARGGPMRQLKLRLLRHHMQRIHARR